MSRKILYVDMDGVICDFESAFDKLDPRVRIEYQGQEDRIPGLFALMDPIPGAITAVTELAGPFDTYVLSTVPWGNTTGASQKIEWIQRYFGADRASPLWKRVILSHHKHLNRGDFLVDDRHRNGAAQFADHNPGGEWLHFGSDRFPDWPAIVAYLRTRVD